MSAEKLIVGMSKGSSTYMRKMYCEKQRTYVPILFIF